MATPMLACCDVQTLWGGDLLALELSLLMILIERERMRMLFASSKLKTTTVVAAASVRLPLFDLSRASWTNSLGAKRSAEPQRYMFCAT